VEAFPSALRLQGEAARLALQLPANLSEYPSRFTVAVLGERIHIPSRVYLPAPAPSLVGLSQLDHQLAQCMLTRSANGFDRQTALRQILSISEPWSIPFVIALAGEYVIEIIDDIFSAIPRLDCAIVSSFLAENPVFYRLTRARITSYWNCYYRHQFHRSEYVGFKLLRELDSLYVRATA
jgi:hypothetical protein